MDVIFQLILILVLILLNGFFVASEVSLIAVRRSRIDELAKKGNTAARLVQQSLNKITIYISATQLGITLASLALGWIGEPTLAHILEPLFGFLPTTIGILSAHTIAIFIGFLLITFLHIVVGELVPKTITLRRAESVSLLLIPPLTFFTTLFMPFIWVLNWSGMGITKLLRSPASEKDSVYTEEEVKMILFQSGEKGKIPKKEVEMVYNVFRLGDTSVSQIMVPRADVIAFDMNTSLQNVIKKVQAHTFSRFPVYNETIETIVGFVHVKDIYKTAFGERKKEKKLSQTGIIRDILTIPQTKTAHEVLREMQKRQIHISVVLDEYGGTAGIVTLEDVLESVVGEIQDEFDKPLPSIIKQKDGSFLVDGTVSLEQIQKKFKLKLKGQSYTTIGGLVFGLLGRIPKVHDVVQIGSLVFTIEKVNARRIKTIRIQKEKKRK